MARSCSAAGLEMPPEQAGLPAPVAKMRKEIAAAAIACDFGRLNALAAQSKQGFTSSFGTGGDQPNFGETPEEAADPRGQLAILVHTLALPHCRMEELYVWPSAYCDEPTPADWAALKGVHAEEDIRMMQEENAFMLHRAGITSDGQWTFFVAGD